MALNGEKIIEIAVVDWEDIEEPRQETDTNITESLKSINLLWDDIKSGINSIYESKNMAGQQYVSLYTLVYDYCVNVQKHLQMTSMSLGINRRAINIELYERLDNLIKMYLKKLVRSADNLTGNDVLNFYAKHWEDYRFSTKVVNGLSGYLNRTWIQRETEDGRAGTYEMYQLGMILWRNTVLPYLEKKVTTAVLKLIKNDRCGELINSVFISIVIKSYIELSINKQSPIDSDDLKKAKFSVYKRSFEDVFIRKTEEFYSRESSYFISRKSITDYMKKVEERMNEEKKRVQTYLHTHTEERLQKICEKVFIENHLETLQCEFKNLLMDDEKTEDLRRMHRLLSKVSGAIDPLLVILEKYIIDEGNSAIKKCEDSAEKEPALYVNKILEVYHKYKNLIKYSFNDDKRFTKVFDKSCKEFINNNAVTKAFKTNSKSPELLAKHCDLLLKKSNKNLEEAEFEEAFDKAVLVFKYVEDKDVFQNYYSKFLAKRLINQTSASDDAEASMISKLKSCCGYQYTSKLQRMFQDIELSKYLNEKFRNPLSTSSNPLNFDFNFQILTSGSWPLKRSITFVLPSEFEKCLQRFGDFYASMYTGRKLNWFHHLGKGELSTNCFKNKYTFQASTMQMAVLLMYNKNLSYTFQQLQDSTGIEKEFLEQLLQIFFKIKLLLCDEEAKLQSTSKISLFTSYKNKKLRVNINTPLKIEQNAEKDATENNIHEDRKIVIQATIVRVMKMRKTLKHQQLIVEVLDQLQNKFKPKILLIKKCISILLEKEYLERNDEETDSYNYLA